jgi:hypothetical protein
MEKKEIAMTGYYAQQLNSVERDVYENLLAGFTALAPIIRVRRLEDKRLSDIFTFVRLDNPRLFYVPSYSYRYMPGAEHVEVLPQYLFEKGKILEHRRSLDARIARLTRPLEKMSAMEKEVAIHDFILSSVSYDKLKKAYSHEIIGPLGQGVGVCEGIAKAVKVLCDAAHLPCLTVLCGNDPENGVKYRHMWNLVQVGGKWYHLDATFDNSLQSGAPRYDYFNLDDKHIYRDHLPPIYPIPACADGNGFFYRSISLTRPEDVENRVKQALRKKREIFVFHWRGGGLNRTILMDLLERCDALARERGKHVWCSVNMAQAVIQLRFGDHAAEEAMTLEQPDEEQES